MAPTKPQCPATWPPACAGATVVGGVTSNQLCHSREGGNPENGGSSLVVGPEQTWQYPEPPCHLDAHLRGHGGIVVIPAKAGIQGTGAAVWSSDRNKHGSTLNRRAIWTPACAGVKG